MSRPAAPIAISRMAAAVQPSATMASAVKAKQMKAEGIQVFDFSLGEPDFPTPEHICKAAIKAMQDGHTRYTPPSGIPELRAAVARNYQRTHGVRYGADQVIVSCGAKHSLHTALATLVGPGDEVIIPTPYWVSYSDLVEMTGARHVLVKTSADNGYKMTPHQLREAVTPRSKLLMLNSPCNPTGTVYARKELEAIADVVLDAGLTVLSDEIYERLIYGSARASSFASLRPELPERTLTVSGASKTFAMTGWRIGWTLGPVHVVRAMGNVQSQQTSNPCSISQYAALAALEGDQECVETMRREFEARRDLVCKRLSAMRGVRCPVPDGAYYAFFNVSAYFGTTLGDCKVTDSASFCKAALDSVKVNLVPGSFFGADECIRLSFATSRDQLNGGLDRLEQLLATAK
jgi:aspartate aminotransferase